MELRLQKLGILKKTCPRQSCWGNLMLEWEDMGAGSRGWLVTCSFCARQWAVKGWRNSPYTQAMRDKALGKRMKVTTAKYDESKLQKIRVQMEKREINYPRVARRRRSIPKLRREPVTAALHEVNYQAERPYYSTYWEARPSYRRRLFWFSLWPWFRVFIITTLLCGICYLAAQIVRLLRL